jgi:hypothetical protein
VYLSGDDPDWQVVRANLAFASSVPILDDAIALGYLLVNTGKHVDALRLFQLLLYKEPFLVAAR